MKMGPTWTWPTDAARISSGGAVAPVAEAVVVSLDRPGAVATEAISPEQLEAENAGLYDSVETVAQKQTATAVGDGHNAEIADTEGERGQQRPLEEQEEMTDERLADIDQELEDLFRCASEETSSDTIDPKPRRDGEGDQGAHPASSGGDEDDDEDQDEDEDEGEGEGEGEDENEDEDGDEADPDTDAGTHLQTGFRGGERARLAAEEQ